MKTKRLKSAPIASEAEFIAILNQIAEVQADRNLIIAKRDRLLLRITERYDLLLGPRESEITALFARAEKYANEHRKELLPKDRKSVALGCVSFGWRTGNPKLGYAHKEYNEETAIAALKEHDFGEYVRTVEELSKEKILADAKTVSVEGVEITGLPFIAADGEGEGVEAIAALRGFGLKITQSESFYIEPKVESGETIKAAEANA